MTKHGHWDKPVKIDIEAQASANAYGWTGKITYAEAGECPVQLRETSEQAVHLWVNKVMTMGHDKGKHYAPSALRLFVRTLGFEFNSNEYRTIIEHIATAIPGSFDPEDYEPEQPDYVEALRQATKPDEVTRPLPEPEPEPEEDDWLAPVEREQTVKGIGGGEDEIKL